jgi:Tfp pilus assembly protein PilZ
MLMLNVVNVCKRLLNAMAKSQLAGKVNWVGGGPKKSKGIEVGGKERSGRKDKL